MGGMLYTGAVDDAPSRVARLSGAQIAEMILRTDAAVFADRIDSRNRRGLSTGMAGDGRACDQVVMTAGWSR